MMAEQQDISPVLTQMASALEALSLELDPGDARDVRDYLDHGEPGVAWELLWHIVREDKLTPPPDLIAAGRSMGFDPE